MTLTSTLETAKQATMNLAKVLQTLAPRDPVIADLMIQLSETLTLAAAQLQELINRVERIECESSLRGL